MRVEEEKEKENRLSKEEEIRKVRKRYYFVWFKLFPIITIVSIIVLGPLSIGYVLFDVLGVFEALGVDKWKILDIAIPVFLVASFLILIPLASYAVYLHMRLINLYIKDDD